MADFKIVYRRQADGGADYAPVGYEQAYLVIGEEAIYLAWTDFQPINHERYFAIVDAVKRLIARGGEIDG